MYFPSRQKTLKERQDHDDREHDIGQGSCIAYAERNKRFLPEQKSENFSASCRSAARENLDGVEHLKEDNPRRDKDE